MAVPNKGQSSQEGVSGDKLLKKTGFLGNISTEETWLLMYIRLYSTRDYLVYGLYQNPTYNIIRCGLGLWGNQEVKDQWCLSAQSQQNPTSAARAGGKGRLLG